MDRLSTMKAFVKVAELGSFIAASEALNISRPMVSKQVQRLEDELGVTLLNRTTRRVALTEAGRQFLRRCRAIFDDIDEAINEASNQRMAPKGELRINAPLSFGRVHLTRAIASFQRIYPDISIDLTLNDRVVDIVDEGYDLAIRIGKLEESSLIARKLAPCRMVLCASPNYLATAPDLTAPGDLKHHNCLAYSLFSEAKAWRFQREGRVQSVPVKGSFRSSYGSANVEAAVMGLGVILEPSFLVGKYIASGDLVPVLTTYQPSALAIYAIYPPNRLLPVKVRAFIDHLAEAYGARPYWDKDLGEGTIASII